MKPKIRMVGLDLDGTVFNNNKEITTHTRSASIPAAPCAKVLVTTIVLMAKANAL